MGVIYKVTNKVNGKVYIGQTIRSFNRRKTEHLNQAKTKRRSCAYFHSALLKYGPDSFEWKIIFESDSQNTLNSKEIEFIKEYNAYGENGYNLCYGGDSNSGYKLSEETIEKRRNFKHSDETKEKARQRMLGTKLSDETKEKIRQANLGKKASEKTKEKMSKSNKGKGTKKVICEETNTIYNSITDAAKAIGCTVGTLSAAIKNNKKVKKLTFKRILNEKGYTIQD